jgi:hypothetical protein
MLLAPLLCRTGGCWSGPTLDCETSKRSLDCMPVRNDAFSLEGVRFLGGSGIPRRGALGSGAPGAREKVLTSNGEAPSASDSLMNSSNPSREGPAENDVAVRSGEREDVVFSGISYSHL